MEYDQKHLNFCQNFLKSSLFLSLPRSQNECHPSVRVELGLFYKLCRAELKKFQHDSARHTVIKEPSCAKCVFSPAILNLLQKELIFLLSKQSYGNIDA